MSEIIKVEHLRYVYNAGMPDETAALDDVSFSIEKGDFVGVMGSTGSGKSTLIAHFNGLNRPTSGKIIIDGRDMWAEGENLRDFRFLVGLVMQYPEYQLFEETCWKDIAYGPRNMGLDEEEITRRVKRAAEFVGLDEALLQKSPFELSGGQKRRVAIAGVMAMEPKILVLDEPAAGLDPEGRDTILSQIRNYHEQTGITVILVSHSIDQIERMCNKVAWLDHGHLRRLGLKPCEHVIHLRVEGILRRELRGVARAAVRRHVLRQRVELAALRAQFEHRQFVALRQKHRAVVGLVLVFVNLRRDFKVQRARLRRRVVLRPAGRSCAAGGQIQRQHAAKQQRHPFFHSVLLSRSRFLAQTITGPSVHALLPLAARSSG